jgi:ketosteroid isomerase-like protein
MTHSVVALWHEIVRSGDAAALDALLAEDVVFHSPVVFRPQVGKALAKAYLAAALETLGNETFRYVGAWDGANSAVLEFVTTIDGVEIDGADFIAWNEAGRIASFKVMVRPLKAIEMVRTKMAERLAVGRET